jgi:hypothetical protein
MPPLASARTSFQPDGAVTRLEDFRRTSIAASITSPKATPEGRAIVSERTLLEEAEVVIPRSVGAAAAVGAAASAVPANMVASRSARLKRLIRPDPVTELSPLPWS